MQCLYNNNVKLIHGGNQFEKGKQSVQTRFQYQRREWTNADIAQQQGDMKDKRIYVDLFVDEPEPETLEHNIWE